jgi:(heptosyl)LPS beta-1,4-glucosyltransferase
MTPLSVVVITKNEEKVIARCLASVSWADEIVVIDSGSTDKTKEIAASLGARIYEQPWLGFSGQRNRGAELAQHDWVFALDADEVVTKELAASIQTTMQGSLDEKDAYAVDRRGDFLGVLLPNETRASKRRNFIRLYNRRHSSYDMNMNVHEEVRFSGRSFPLEGVLLHWNGYSMDELLSLFNRYATIEANELNRLGKRTNAVEIFLRPILRFLWSYIAKGGFRLGTRGLMHSLLKGSSDFMRYAKLWELQNVKAMPNPPEGLAATPVPKTPETVKSTPRQPVDQLSPQGELNEAKPH